MNLLPVMLVKPFARRRCRSALSKPGLALFAALLTLIPLTSPAGNLQLVDSPLFLQTAVQPNIFFMTDDSGSMRSEVLFLDRPAMSFASPRAARVEQDRLASRWLLARR